MRDEGPCFYSHYKPVRKLRTHRRRLRLLRRLRSEICDFRDIEGIQKEMDKAGV